MDGGNELIDDGAVSTSGQDLLGHKILAAELADVVMAVPTPNNIALFGAWGSGKTGIGNLLADELTKREPKPRFVRYDAYKYAETPLRRHFLEAVASQLGGGAEKRVRETYESRTSSRLTLPRRDLGWVAGLFAGVLAIYCGASLVLSLLGGHGLSGVADDLRAALPGGLPISVVAVIVLGAFGKSLSVQVSKSAPATDDEFESLFRSLIKGSGEKRVVVFIDELDRCSPAEVTATLDAIRTFLGVDRCVFVVSADQQVLERALSSALRQHTPIDVANSYYTSGSAVLDKLFVHQLHVPPPPPRRLTRFARDLVKEKPGLWNEVDLDRVVSVLIPAHVASPRRVKTLLNSFAVAYRLTRRYVSEGRVRGPAEDRAQELAKLVCLRVEFPLFAACLGTVDGLLPLVLKLHEDATVAQPPLVHDLAWRMAKRFATGEMKADVLIGQEAIAAADTGEADASATEDLDNARMEQSAQLFDYLQRTRSINGPDNDLIHLEHEGRAVGLASETARLIETAAVNGSVDDALRIVHGMADVSDDTLDAPAARVIRLITGVGQQAAIGIEAENVSKVLLAVAGETKPLAASTADLAITSLDSLGFPKIQDSQSCAHAMALAAVASVDVQPILSTAFDYLASLGDEESEADVKLIQLAGHAKLARDPRLGDVVARCLRRSTSARAALADIEGAAAKSILDTARDSILTLAQEDAAATAAAVPIPTAAAVPVADAADLSGDAIADLVKRLFSKPETSDQIIRLALDAERKPLRDAVFSLLGAGYVIGDPETALRVLTVLRRRYVATWATALRTISADIVASDAPTFEPLRAALEQLILNVVEMSTATAQDQTGWEDSLVEVKRLALWMDQSVLDNADARLGEVMSGLAPVDLDGRQRVTAAFRAMLGAALITGVQSVNALATLATQAIPTLISGTPVLDLPGWQAWIVGVCDEATLMRMSIDSLRQLQSVVPADGGTAHMFPVSILRETHVLCDVIIRRKEPGNPRSVDVTTAITWAHSGPAEDVDRLLSFAFELADDAMAAWSVIAAAGGPDLGPLSQAALSRWLAAHPDQLGMLSDRVMLAVVEGSADNSMATRIVRPDMAGKVLASKLVGLYEGTTDFASRLRLVRLWQVLSPNGEAAISVLVRKVYVPFVQSGPDGVRECIRAIALLQGASASAREEAIRAMRDAVPNDEAKDLEAHLVRAGFRKRMSLKKMLRLPERRGGDDQDEQAS
jgi:KAP family P-loop domain